MVMNINSQENDTPAGELEKQKSRTGMELETNGQVVAANTNDITRLKPST
jgi:hypothetical protein